MESLMSADPDRAGCNLCTERRLNVNNGTALLTKQETSNPEYVIR
jgi:hypothetical protein